MTLEPTTMQWVGAILFGLALAHTFSTKFILRLAHHCPRHQGVLHLLGEVEVVFALWATILLAAMVLLLGGGEALSYFESRQYTEPAFVFVVMVIAASKPVIACIKGLLNMLARLLPVQTEVAFGWLALAVVPLVGSLITEPAAMTLAALMLRDLLFRSEVREWRKYAALGVLFVNVSIGGTLTNFAAPPVLMVAGAWGWDSLFMLTTFGWKAAVAVLVNATAVTALLYRDLCCGNVSTEVRDRVPLPLQLVHLVLLAGVVVAAHHPLVFLAIFVLFLAVAKSYEEYQAPLILKEALMVGVFLAGLVLLGGLQQWWLQPIVSSLSPLELYWGATALTGITDNAALTYLGSLIQGISPQAQYMLVAGAVTGGGLTVIANAPNPAGAALLRGGFRDGAVGFGGLFLGALAPTAVTAAAFLLL